MPPAQDKLTGRTAASGRDARRQLTRQRVYAAALAEFKRTGMAAADVGDIATAAGVARGTFYFHYPTKEHVLAELERHEEARLVGQLSKFLAELEARLGPPTAEPPPAGQRFLPAALAELVRLLTAMERRVGKTLFREMLGLHFSSRRPDVLPGADQWGEYPVMTVVVEAVERARERGEVRPAAGALPTAQLFMVGLYAMLIASHEYPKAARAEILDNFMSTVLRGIAPADEPASRFNPEAARRGSTARPPSPRVLPHRRAASRRATRFAVTRSRPSATAIAAAASTISASRWPACGDLPTSTTWAPRTSSPTARRIGPNRSGTRPGVAVRAGPGRGARA